MHTWFFGELLMRLECENSDRLEQTEHFHVRYTGAEANAAVAMCSLGAENIHLLSAVPENPIGRSCLDALRKYGPDTAHVLRIPGDSRLGLFFLETGVSLRPSQVVYDRKHSAFAETPFDAYHVNALFRTFSAPGWLHLSGTLPALNECCRESAFQIIRAAKKANYTVSFDLNYRAALWSESDAQTCFRELVKDIDVLIANAGVAESFLETPEAELCRRFGFTAAALTRREDCDASHTGFGGTLYRQNGRRFDVPMRRFAVLDRIGGGDAFAGAMIYALQQPEWTDERRIRFATACGMLKHATRGDFSLSTRAEVDALLAGNSLAVKR